LAKDTISAALNEAGVKAYPSHAVGFFVAVNDYFRAAMKKPKISRLPSLYRDILEELEGSSKAPSKELVGEVLGFLAAASRELADAWTEVTMTYAVARRELLE